MWKEKALWLNTARGKLTITISFIKKLHNIFGHPQCTCLGCGPLVKLPISMVLHWTQTQPSHGYSQTQSERDTLTDGPRGAQELIRSERRRCPLTWLPSFCQKTAGGGFPLVLQRKVTVRLGAVIWSRGRTTIWGGTAGQRRGRQQGHHTWHTTHTLTQKWFKCFFQCKDGDVFLCRGKRRHEMFLWRAVNWQFMMLAIKAHGREWKVSSLVIGCHWACFQLQVLTRGWKSIILD